MAPKWWEKAKMLCLPKKVCSHQTSVETSMTMILRQDSSDAFLRVVGISEPTKSEYKEFMMYLDTGCVVSNLVSSDVVVQALGIPLPSRQSPSVIGMCLNGEELKSSGKMTLKWRAKGFHKIFMTEFDVVMGKDLPWDIILGAATIREHKILKFAGFGLHVVTKTGGWSILESLWLCADVSQMTCLQIMQIFKAKSSIVLSLTLR
jgi:hypothetical protein